MSVALVVRPHLLEGVRSALTSAAEAPLWSLSSDELTDLVREAGAVLAAAQAVLMQAVRAADARDTLVAEGAASSRPGCGPGSGWRRRRRLRM